MMHTRKSDSQSFRIDRERAIGAAAYFFRRRIELKIALGLIGLGIVALQPSVVLILIEAFTDISTGYASWIGTAVGIALILLGCIWIWQMRRFEREEWERGKGISVVPAETDNWAKFGEEKYKQNGRFFVDISFMILNGNRGISVVGIDTCYYATDCFCQCLMGTPTVRIAGHLMEYDPDWQRFLQPYQAGPYESINVWVRRDCRPPLMTDEPINCDFGCITAKVLYRINDAVDLLKKEYVFQLRPHGVMEEIKELPPPSLLSDETLSSAAAKGLLTSDELERLKTLPPRRRCQSVKNKHLNDVSDEMHEFLVEIDSRIRAAELSEVEVNNV